MLTYSQKALRCHELGSLRYLTNLPWSQHEAAGPKYDTMAAKARAASTVALVHPVYVSGYCPACATLDSKVTSQCGDPQLRSIASNCTTQMLVDPAAGTNTDLTKHSVKNEESGNSDNVLVLKLCATRPACNNVAAESSTCDSPSLSYVIRRN